ncbi:unnamed protein product, partial [marine sediment metagenome]
QQAPQNQGQQNNRPIDSGDIIAKLDADFTLMAGELNRMIGHIHCEFNVSSLDYLE